MPVQVTAAVVQVVELALVGQGQGLQVAQFIVVVLQKAGAVSLAKQLTEGVVDIVETLLVTSDVGEVDRQQVVGSVIGILGDAIVGAFENQADEGITFELV